MTCVPRPEQLVRSTPLLLVPCRRMARRSAGFVRGGRVGWITSTDGVLSIVLVSLPGAWLDIVLSYLHICVRSCIERFVHHVSLSTLLSCSI